MSHRIIPDQVHGKTGDQTQRPPIKMIMKKSLEKKDDNNFGNLHNLQARVKHRLLARCDNPVMTRTKPCTKSGNKENTKRKLDGS